MTVEHDVVLAGVMKSFGEVAVLTNFDLQVAAGEFHTVLGPSGSGKTTALRIIAGFESPQAGTVHVGGRQVAGPTRFVPPEDRRVGMVFQDFALFPHLTVGANIGYGVRSNSEKRRRVAELLAMVGMAGFERRFPHELSGGQQQRVALARALAPRPKVVLLDEPFSNLDASLRDRVRTDIKQILTEARTTVLFVTHDQEEALSLSDRVSVIREGKVIQTASPADLYRRPIDQWTASFLGEAQFLRGHARGGIVQTRYGSFSTSLEGPVVVMVRPERVFLRQGDDGIVIRRQYFGHDQLITIALADGAELSARVGPLPDLAIGERVGLEIEDAVVYPSPST